jgi:hypothetical protein
MMGSMTNSNWKAQYESANPSAPAELNHNAVLQSLWAIPNDTPVKAPMAENQRVFTIAQAISPET